MEKFELELNEGEETEFSQASRPKKLITTASIFYGTFCLGIGVTFLGPTVIDFSHKFNTDVSQVSYVFTIILAFYVVGALLNGILSHFIDRQVIVIVLFTICSVAFYLVPHVRTITLFFVLAALLGTFSGGYDSAQLAWIIDIWRHESAPFILTQHFFYSVGTIFPPLILSPFLKGKEPLSTAGNVSITSAENSTEQLLVEIRGGSDLWIPFTVAGSLLALGLIFQVALYVGLRTTKKIRKSSIVPDPTSESAEEAVQSKGKGIGECPDTRKIILITLSCIFVAFYAGMELCSMQFLPTFAHFSTINMSESEGADVLFGLTMANCIFHGVGIFIVLKVAPHYIVFGNLALSAVSNLILVYADDSVTNMWLGSMLLGVGMSTTFPAYFAYLEKYLFISDSVSAIILIPLGVVSAIYPIIVGSYVETNPIVMIYVNFFSLFIVSTSFVITFWLTFCKSGKAEDVNVIKK